MYQVLDWLDENTYRAYPLREQEVILINDIAIEDILLDANLVYDDVLPGEDVKLETIEVDGSDIYFFVTSQQPFFIENFAAQEYPLAVRNSAGSLLVFGEGTKQLYSNSSPNAKFESSVILEVAGPWLGVSSMKFNGSPEKSGDVTWLEGFQFKITGDDQEITLGAKRNFGSPISCEVFFPSVASDCEDIISYINSVGVNNNPDKFNFLAGSNISIFEDPENHRIYIGLNFTEEDVCETPLPNPSI